MWIQWRNVRLVFLRELRDRLRDRRTLFMVFILPLLLYPTLGIGMLQLTLVFTEKQRTVVLLGEENLPPPPLLEGNHFVGSLFKNPQRSSKLRVVTETELKAAQAAQTAAKSTPETRDQKKLDAALAKAQTL